MKQAYTDLIIGGGGVEFTNGWERYIAAGLVLLAVLYAAMLAALIWAALNRPFRARLAAWLIGPKEQH